MDRGEMTEHRLTKIENDIGWLKKLNWTILSTTLINAIVLIIKGI